jgi:hypothetical protein
MLASAEALRLALAEALRLALAEALRLALAEALRLALAEALRLAAPKQVVAALAALKQVVAALAALKQVVAALAALKTAALGRVAAGPPAAPELLAPRRVALGLSAAGCASTCSQIARTVAPVAPFAMLRPSAAADYVALSRR